MDTERPPPWPARRLEAAIVRVTASEDGDVHGLVQWVRTGVHEPFETGERLLALLRAGADGIHSPGVG